MEHQLQKSLPPAEPLPRLTRSHSLGSNGSAQRSLHILDDVITKEKEQQELNNKVEQLLLKQIKEGDTNAIFQLGQFYFEQVRSQTRLLMMQSRPKFNCSRTVYVSDFLSKGLTQTRILTQPL